jgi:predicted TIM-barrel fold metal-dependent hydrolase
MGRAYKYVSGDGHIEVNSNLWVHRVAEKYRDRAPYVVSLPNGGDGWVIEGSKPREVSADLYGGKGRDVWLPFGQSYETTPGTGGGEQRLAEQDKDGVDAEVLFPGQVSGPGFWRNVPDDDAYKAIVRGYNDWLGEEYCSADRDRLIGLAVIPWCGVRDSIDEMHHAAELGLKGVMLAGFPNGTGRPAPEDDEFWAEALNMGMPITVHVDFSHAGERAGAPFTYPQEHPEVRGGLIEQVARFSPSRGSGALGAVQLTMAGVWDRFPDLRILFAENQIGWIPFFLQTADVRYDRHVIWSEKLLGYKPLDRYPSEYMREHCLWGFQYDPIGVELRHHLGVDHLLWGSDFPHQESDWPNSAEIIKGNFEGIPEDESYQMVAGNAIDFFHLDAE